MNSRNVKRHASSTPSPPKKLRTEAIWTLCKECNKIEIEPPLASRRGPKKIINIVAICLDCKIAKEEKLKEEKLIEEGNQFN